MAQVLMTLGWILIGLSGVVVAYQFLGPLVKFDPLINGLPAAVLIALGGQLLTQGKHLKETSEKRSLFYLDSCIKGYEEARNLLADDNNDRVTWIAAGRALVHAKTLGSNVTEDSHLRVLELHRLKYRNAFHDALADKPAAFFFGATDTSIPTDRAAELSTAREECGGRTVVSNAHELSMKSLRAVWEAAQWPADYEDPLDQSFSEEEHAKLLVLFPGLHEFLEHKKRWISACGRLLSRNRE